MRYLIPSLFFMIKIIRSYVTRPPKGRAYSTVKCWKHNFKNNVSPVHRTHDTKKIQHANETKRNALMDDSKQWYDN